MAIPNSSKDFASSGEESCAFPWCRVREPSLAPPLPLPPSLPFAPPLDQRGGRASQQLLLAHTEAHRKSEHQRERENVHCSHTLTRPNKLWPMRTTINKSWCTKEMARKLVQKSQTKLLLPLILLLHCRLYRAQHRQQQQGQSNHFFKSELAACKQQIEWPIST